MFHKVSDKELIFFTSQLSLLMETGSSLTESLGAIEPQITNRDLREATQAIGRDVQAGKMLSSALAKRPKIFSQIYVSMVRAGEMGGFLVEMLQRLVQMLKLKEGLASKVKSAMAYPAILTFMSVAVVVFMMTFVLPRFAVLFEGKEAILPVTTRMLIWMASLIENQWPWLLLAIAAAITGIILLLRTKAGRLFWQRTLLRLPLVGPVCKMIYVARLLRTLGGMLDSGIPLLDGVDVTRGTVGNAEFAAFLDKVEENVKEGRNLADPFSASPLFAPSVKQMVQTAEMTGSSGVVMLKMADHYDEELELRLKTLTSMLEPIIVVVMGTVVGFIALSLFLPLFKISRGVY